MAIICRAEMDLLCFFDSQSVGVYQSNDGLGLSVRCVKE